MGTRHQPIRRRTRRGSFAFLAAVLGLVVSVLIVEVVLRVGHIEPPRHGAPDWYVIPDDTPSDGAFLERPAHPPPHKRPSPFAPPGPKSGEFVPGIRIRMVYPSNPRGYFDEGNGIAFQINRLGLRGPEISGSKPAGTYRVLGLGDSFTFGEGVREEDTFLRILETRFNENHGDRRQFEFLNAGVGGYNTFDEVLYLDRKWSKLSPDAVLIVFFLNDMFTHQMIMEMGEDVGANLSQPEGMAQWSYAWDYAQHSLATRRQARKIEEFYRREVFRDPGSSVDDPAANVTDWRRSRAGLEHAAEIARTDGLELGLVIFPMLYELQDDHPFDEVHRFVASTAEEIGIPVLDLLPAFRGRKAKDLWVSAGDHHPNEVAHRIAADEIEGFLERLLASALKDPTPSSEPQ